LVSSKVVGSLELYSVSPLLLSLYIQQQGPWDLGTRSGFFFCLSWLEKMSASSAAAAAAQKMLLKSERHLFSSSDDAAVMKQILATHAPDGREVDVRALLQIVEDILQRATPTVIVVMCA